MNKEKVEKAIKLSKDIDALKEFIKYMILNRHINPVVIRNPSYNFSSTEYIRLKTSQQVYNNITNDIIKLLEVKLQELENELENL